ncbi:methyl-accepting chemotaxis protein [Pseudomonas sediminis]|uniref:Methyl-accepting chemotaxis protein n=2 Tax=Pseudomonas sediminis TaxID=1691904 RepID=A0ABX6SP59_9PSED|nr:methyl-accepting chemotaxis protein [Pseudomonas sediminis]QNH02505.1 methyl-accepting chemotaxis protein [Pseudomonas sediminis]
MNRLKFRHKILTAAAFIVVLAFGAFALFNDYYQRNTLRSEVENNLTELGALTTSNIQTWLHGHMRLVESMAQQLARSDDLPEIVGLPVYGSTFQMSYFGSSAGEMYSVPAAQRASDYDPRARGWYQAAQKASGTVVTEPYIAASTGKLVITVASPVVRDGQTIGVAGADIDLTTISNIINSLSFEGNGHAFIANANNKVLIHPRAELILKPLDEIFTDSNVHVNQPFGELEQDGDAQFISFTALKDIPSADWKLGLVMNQHYAFSMLDAFRTSAAIAALVAVAIIILLLGLLIKILMKPLFTMGKTMEGIADGDGDLTQRLTIQHQDEFGQIGLAFNRFVHRIHSSIHEVASVTQQVNAMATQVIEASNSSLQHSDQQANRTESVAAAINQLGAAAHEIASNAAATSQHSSLASELAAQGQDVLGQSISTTRELSEKIANACTTIETLNAKTDDIGQILDVISGISQQTNLLALNAAIEAARAGEAGRGFAVVADEVRSLAHRTQASAQQIQQMIDELQEGARQAVNIMTESQRQSESTVRTADNAGERLGLVATRIGEIDGMNQSVATATEEQTAVVESINQDVDEINVLSQSCIINLRTSLAACENLSAQARRLDLLVGGFRL